MSLKEATSTNGTIEDLERLLKIDADTGYELGIIPQPKDSDTPFAWDAGIEVKDGIVHIDGGFAPGGPEGGRVHIEVPYHRFKSSFELRCDYSAIDDAEIPNEDKDFIRSMCDSY